MEDKIQRFIRQKISCDPLKQPKPDISPERDDSATFELTSDTIIDEHSRLKIRIKEQEKVKAN